MRFITDAIASLTISLVMVCREVEVLAPLLVDGPAVAADEKRDVEAPLLVDGLEDKRCEAEAPLLVDGPAVERCYISLVNKQAIFVKEIVSIDLK